jgi:hypothetical protein
MWSLYVRGAFPEGAPAGPILSANVEVHVGHGTRPLEAARDTHHAANSLHYLAGYYIWLDITADRWSSSGSSPEKTLV